MFDHRLLFPSAGADDARRLLDRGQAHAARRNLTRVADLGAFRTQPRRGPSATASR